MWPTARTSPPTSPDIVVTRSVMVRQRMRQANWPLPNLVLLKRITGAADRLVRRARQSMMESARMFCCCPAQTSSSRSSSRGSRREEVEVEERITSSPSAILSVILSLSLCLSLSLRLCLCVCL